MSTCAPKVPWRSGKRKLTFLSATSARTGQKGAVYHIRAVKAITSASSAVGAPIFCLDPAALEFVSPRPSPPPLSFLALRVGGGPPPVFGSGHIPRHARTNDAPPNVAAREAMNDEETAPTRRSSGGGAAAAAASDPPPGGFAIHRGSRRGN